VIYAINVAQYLIQHASSRPAAAGGSGDIAASVAA
jgi:hypothetical protein